ncbi:MAG: hypothetical protein WC289_04145 [Patescibacteria group bacterium]|jgi:hypothetical protein
MDINRLNLDLLRKIFNHELAIDLDQAETQDLAIRIIELVGLLQSDDPSQTMFEF